MNLNIINLFVSYKYYNEFCSKVYLEIAKFGFDIDNIIISIIDLYIKHIEKFNMAYVPCIIIDNYNPENNELYNKLLLSQAKNDFRIIMVYQLKSPISNKIITDYLDDKKKESFEFKYTKTLYSKIEKLPNKYENIFKEMIPTIYNYLKINNCKSEKDAKKFLKDEEKDIISEIQTFYNDNISKMNLYLNEISILIGKELNIKNDFIKNIFLNTPLNVFDLTILENYNITINYASKSVKKIVYDICSSSIIDLLPKLNDLNLDNFVKGGIFERRIKELLKKKKPIFGMIDNIVQFDCILNYFKAKKNYEFSPVEIDDNLKKLKNIKKLVEKYKNYTYNNNIMIVQEQNGKDWDFSIIYKDDSNNNIIHLYLVQVSINKNEEEIKIILQYFEKKKNFIIKKIEKILNIQVNVIHILFIFLKQTQNQKTISFLQKYKIPYIYYDLEKNDFFNENNEIINNFHLKEITSFTENKLNWELSIENFKDTQSNDDLNSFEDEIEESNGNDKGDINLQILSNQNQLSFD